MSSRFWLFLIKSYPYLQVMRTCINAWMIIPVGNDLLWLNVPVNNFSVMSGRSHRFPGITSTFSGSKCVFAQGNKIALVGIEPPTSRSGVRGSTTRSPCSPCR